MKKSLLLSALITLVAAAGCAKKSSAVCAPSNSWHAPAYRCGVAPEPAAEAEPEAEPEPEGPVRVRDDRIEILEKVQFAVGSAEILDESYTLLDAVAQTLNDHPEITQIRVEGHTDSTGSAALNRRLSKERAQSVMQYLVDRDVAAERLEAEGYGPDKPLADNDSDSGRETNRRVEFAILSRK